MLADPLDVVIGVDTHRDRHALAVVDARTGMLEAEHQISADPAGYRRAGVICARRRRVWAIEGTGAYGAGLCRYLRAHGEQVIEIDRPGREPRRGGKSDAIDALRAARQCISRKRHATPRAEGRRQAVRVLVAARSSAVATRTTALNQMAAIIVSAPDALRAPLRALGPTRRIARCRAMRPGAIRDPELAGHAAALKALAERAHAARAEARELERMIGEHVRALAPALLEEPGVGALCAAQLLISFSHPGRLHSEAAFARLGGVAPIPASSGRRVRHRLDRGGDRQLNRALHTILVARRRSDARTQAYIARRVAEGKTAREAMRCLKRYLARHLFRLLEAAEQTP